jgi:hypothetical protein
VKEKIQKVFRQNIPFVVVFVTALIWHLVIKISAWGLDLRMIV